VLRYLKLFFSIFFIPIWFLQKLIPRNRNLWVFGEWNGLRYGDNAKDLFEYVVKNEDNILAVWLTRNPSIFHKLKEEGKLCELTNSFKGIYYSLKAGYVIYSNGKSDVNSYFINGAIIINTWHGAPMKKIGLDDSMGFSKNRNLLIESVFPFLCEFNIDAIVSTAEIFNNKLSTAFNLKLEDIICTGYPRNDIFFSTVTHPLIEEWNLKFNNPRKIIYLPTFRSKEVHFNPFSSYGFSEDKWNNFLEYNNSILIFKGHFADVSGFRGKLHSQRIIFIPAESLEDLNLLLKDVDFLITDYSGVYFDYLLTLKPIIFAPFDISEYLCKSRELYFNYASITCGPICESWNEVISALKDFMLMDNFLNQRIEARDRFNKYHDDMSALRLANFIINEAGER